MIIVTGILDRSNIKAALLAAAMAAALGSPTYLHAAEQTGAESGSQKGSDASQPSNESSGSEAAGSEGEVEKFGDSAQEKSESQSGDQAAAKDEAQEGEGSSGKGKIMAEQRSDQILVQDLLGMDVVNEQGTKLGTLDNVVLNQDGQVAGIVLARGGFLGVGAKPVGIAWSDLATAANADVLTLNLTPEEIDKAPEFKTKVEKRREEQQQQMEQQQQTGGGDGTNQ